MVQYTQSANRHDRKYCSRHVVKFVHVDINHNICMYMHAMIAVISMDIIMLSAMKLPFPNHYVTNLILSIPGVVIYICRKNNMFMKVKWVHLKL